MEGEGERESKIIRKKLLNTNESIYTYVQHEISLHWDSQ